MKSNRVIFWFTIIMGSTLAGVVTAGLIHCRSALPRICPELREIAPTSIPKALSAGSDGAGMSQEPVQLAGDEPLSLLWRIIALRAKNAVLNAELKHYRRKLFGQTVPWPDDTPPLFRPDEFEVKFSQALDDCQSPADLVDFDCIEPPCLAILRSASGQSQPEALEACLRRNIGVEGGTSSQHVRVTCDDGRVETLVIFHLVWKELFSAQGANIHTRIDDRRRAIVSAWKCL